MSAIDPQTLLEQLCVNSHPRKEASLRLIYRLCEEQHDRGSADFSIATIGRLSQGQGGPSAAAIRNKTGEAYRALMKAFAASVGGKAKRSAERKVSELDDLLEGVIDPVLRARVGILLAEATSLRGQIAALRHLASQTAVLVLPGQETAPATPIGVDPALTAQEMAALQKAVAPETLSHWGWVEEANGRVKTEAGQVVYPAGYMTAIRKVLKASGK